MSRDGGDLSPLQRRLAFVASRRSMREMEELLARFLGQRLPHLDDSTCATLLSLLQEADADLLDWLGGVTPPPARVGPDLLDLLRPFRTLD